MEFKSQICTTKEQSERLLTLGLKKETADMAIPHPYFEKFITVPIEHCLNPEHCIPAWSLHRLIELYSDVEDTSSLCIKDISYKLLIFCIEKAIYCRLFNQDYLEENNESES